VIFHWANRDQYYAKSGEWLKAYRFNIKGYRVAFEIREPAQNADDAPEGGKSLFLALRKQSD
jgi:hypothetical protein